MSNIDWSARQGGMGQHHHFKSQIIDESTAEVAVLSGGGSISVYAIIATPAA